MLALTLGAARSLLNVHIVGSFERVQVIAKFDRHIRPDAAMSSRTRSSIGCEKLTTHSAHLANASTSSRQSSMEWRLFHSEAGFSALYRSLKSTLMGSVAIRRGPVFDTTFVTSGKLRSTRSTWVVVRTDWLSDTLGSCWTCMASAPSSSRGMNSEPRKGNMTPLTTTSAAAAAIALNRLRVTNPRAGLYHLSHNE